jgi:hypothetical protein
METEESAGSRRDQFMGAPEPSTAQKVAAVPRALGRGVAGIGTTLLQAPEVGRKVQESVLGRLPPRLRKLTEAVTAPVLGGSALTPALGGKKVEKQLHQWGREAARHVEKSLKAPEGTEGSFWLSDLPEATGSALGFMAAGGAGMAAKMPAWLSTGLAGAAVNGTSEYYEHLASKPEDEDGAAVAALIGYGVGATEAIPLHRMLNRVFGAVPEGKILRTALYEGGEELLQETGQTAASNAIAMGLRDEDRELWDGIWRSGAAGGLTGMMMSVSMRRWGAPGAVEAGVPGVEGGEQSAPEPGTVAAGEAAPRAEQSIAEDVAEARKIRQDLDLEVTPEEVDAFKAEAAEKGLSVFELAKRVAAEAESAEGATRDIKAEPADLTDDQASELAYFLTEVSQATDMPWEAVRDAKAVKPASPEQEWAAEWATQRGMNVVFVDAGSPLPVSAMHNAGTGTVFMDARADAGRSFRATLFHEAGHELKTVDPEGWEALRGGLEKANAKILQLAGEGYATDMPSVWSALSAEGQAEESVSVVIEQLGQYLEFAYDNPRAFQEIVSGDRALWQRAMDAVFRALNKLLKTKLPTTFQRRAKKLAQEMRKRGFAGTKADDAAAAMSDEEAVQFTSMIHEAFEAGLAEEGAEAQRPPAKMAAAAPFKGKRARRPMTAEEKAEARKHNTYGTFLDGAGVRHNVDVLADDLLRAKWRIAVRHVRRPSPGARAEVVTIEDEMKRRGLPIAIITNEPITELPAEEYDRLTEKYGTDLPENIPAEDRPRHPLPEGVTVRRATPEETVRILRGNYNYNEESARLLATYRYKASSGRAWVVQDDNRSTTFEDPDTGDMVTEAPRHLFTSRDEAISQAYGDRPMYQTGRLVRGKPSPPPSEELDRAAAEKARIRAMIEKARGLEAEAREQRRKAAAERKRRPSWRPMFAAGGDYTEEDFADDGPVGYGEGVVDQFYEDHLRDAIIEAAQELYAEGKHTDVRGWEDVWDELREAAIRESGVEIADEVVESNDILDEVAREAFENDEARERAYEEDGYDSLTEEARERATQHDDWIETVEEYINEIDAERAFIELLEESDEARERAYEVVDEYEDRWRYEEAIYEHEGWTVGVIDIKDDYAVTDPDGNEIGYFSSWEDALEAINAERVVPAALEVSASKYDALKAEYPDMETLGDITDPADLPLPEGATLRPSRIVTSVWEGTDGKYHVVRGHERRAGQAQVRILSGPWTKEEHARRDARRQRYWVHYPYGGLTESDAGVIGDVENKDLPGPYTKPEAIEHAWEAAGDKWKKTPIVSRPATVRIGTPEERAAKKAAESERWRKKYRDWLRGDDPRPPMFAAAPRPPNDPDSFVMDRERFWEKQVRRFTDKFKRQEIAQERIKKARGVEQLPDDMDAYLQQEIMSGKTDDRARRFDLEEVKPLAALMRDNDIDMDNVGDYAWARHAEERNEFIMQRDLNERRAKSKTGRVRPKWGHESNPASGMKTSKAKELVASYEGGEKGDVYRQIGAILDRIGHKDLDQRVADGLINASLAQELKDRWNHYVPLRTLVKPMVPRQGKGFHFTGPEWKKAKGRRSAPDNPMIFLLSQFQEGIVRGEKNQVKLALLKQVRENPAPRVWSVQQGRKGPVIGPDGELTMLQDPRFQLDELVVAVKENGEESLIVFNDKLMARAWKNLGAETLSGLTKAGGWVTRKLSSINTSLDPEFIVSNLLRDLQTAGINLAGEEGSKMARRVLTDVVNGNAMRSMYRALRGKEAREGSQWDAWAEEFMAAGGKVGWFHAKDFDASVKDLQKKMRRISSNPETAKDTAAEVIDRTFTWIEDANGSVENAVRLSAYVHARKAGLSKARAASLAKNLTVNFNRKGELGTAANAAYMFFNASIQGSARLVRALKHKRVRQIAGAVATTSMLMDLANRWSAGFDDDGENYYDKIPDYIKNRNFIFMNPARPGEYFKLPLPYGYNIFHAAGVAVGSGIIPPQYGGGPKTAVEAGAAFIPTVWESFSPIGSEASLFQLAMPTVADPFIQHAENRTFYGAPLKPVDKGFGPPTPKSQQYWNSTGPFPKWVSATINELTGGDTVQPGMVDISPEHIQHYFDFVTGGVGRTGRRGLGLFAKPVAGEELPLKEIPFARRVYGEPSESHVSQTFYQRLEDIEQAITRHEAHPENLTEEQQVLRRQKQRAKATRKRVGILRTRRDAAKTAEERRKWEEQMDKEMRRFNKTILETTAKWLRKTTNVPPDINSNRN